MAMNIAPEVVTLRGGLVVSVEAINLLLDLERRGLEVHVDDNDGAVVVWPGRLLSDQDKRAIRAYRDHLKALVAYCEQVQ